ncbi:DUF3099 domain-containing protein [Streptomyces sp. 8L]|uniref:DUF3099 domain-containing protein n=1 Tax=Streptomyces sp. 8L TaxID=2877242 RepID=UPI001CD70769|nr:DUF3099 domain-containing protein [Streptomyces sp. 8L]MCA1222259.1 DUF3099 domain-containing protein [Streptomyces sp. 8L]
MRKHNDNGVFRITGARTGLQEDVRGRQRRYVISMGIRTIAVILTVVLWDVERPVAFATLVVGMLLPYVAVVIANAGRENAPSLPSLFVRAPDRPMITAGSASTKDQESEEARRSGEHADARSSVGATARESAPAGEGASGDRRARRRGDRV